MGPSAIGHPNRRSAANLTRQTPFAQPRLSLGERTCRPAERADILLTVRYLTTILAAVLLASAAHAEPDVDPIYAADDTLAIRADDKVAANTALQSIRWEPTKFDVRVQAPDAGLNCDKVLTFPSPRPAGKPNQDRVRLRWFAAKDQAGQVIDAPAVLVVHSIHPRLVVAKMLARGLQPKGIHVFVIEMPGFGARTDPPRKYPSVVTLEHAQQSIADARRARDAIAAIPQVANDRVSIVGPSLGGFIATVTASLDGAFDHAFFIISGGDTFDVLTNGKRDAAFVRHKLHQAGYDDEELRKLLMAVEPLNVAHRLDPTKTWLINAADDTVVPLRNGELLAKTIGLKDDHHLVVPGTHYSFLFSFPRILSLIETEVVEEEATKKATTQPTEKDAA